MGAADIWAGGRAVAPGDVRSSTSLSVCEKSLATIEARRAVWDASPSCLVFNESSLSHTTSSRHLKGAHPLQVRARCATRRRCRFPDVGAEGAHPLHVRALHDRHASREVASSKCCQKEYGRIFGSPPLSVSERVVGFGGRRSFSIRESRRWKDRRRGCQTRM